MSVDEYRCARVNRTEVKTALKVPPGFHQRRRVGKGVEGSCRGSKEEPNATCAAGSHDVPLDLLVAVDTNPEREGLRRPQVHPEGGGGTNPWLHAVDFVILDDAHLSVGVRRVTGLLACVAEGRFRLPPVLVRENLKLGVNSPEVACRRCDAAGGDSDHIAIGLDGSMDHVGKSRGDGDSLVLRLRERMNKGHFDRVRRFLPSMTEAVGTRSLDTRMECVAQNTVGVGMACGAVM